MTRHLGASIFLSVALVVFFAIVLYQPEKPAPATSPPQAAATVAEPDLGAQSTPPAVTPTVPLVEATPPSPVASPGRSDPTPAQPAVPRVPPATAARPSRDVPMVQAVSQKRPLTSARSAFTEVAKGETLLDVAVRVYGSADATRSLWMANRDILHRRDAPLESGTLLRTP